MAPNPIAARKVVKKAVRAEKAIFRGLTLSIAGTITNSAGGIIKNEDIMRWFKIHGGSFVTEVDEATTHLICSIDEYNKGKNSSQGAFLRYETGEMCVVDDMDFQLKEPVHLQPKIINVRSSFLIGLKIVFLERGNSRESREATLLIVRFCDLRREKRITMRTDRGLKRV